ncbi:MAG: TonB-dependent receptor [Sphingobacteriaceae bacterium]|nr:MAG: TonB-dependent receptor [Sphingobacteriaceae bacterium]
MRKLNLLVIALCIFHAGFNAAHGQVVNHTLKGVVTDSATQQPVPYATISITTPEGTPVKAGYTKTDGSFILDKIPAGKYTLSVINIGYATKTTTVDITANIDAGKIPIAAQSRELKEVQVTATRPIVRQDVDRITYDIQADPDSKLQNMLDMMRKVPLISLDAGDNIRMKSSSDFKILINGRPSGMMTRNPRDALRSMRASNIQKVEVITTPPAKYDGEGLAGIINIVTNKRVDEGYNGNIGAYYITYESYGTWTDLNVKKGKFGVTVYAEGFMRAGQNAGFNNFRQIGGQVVEQTGKSNGNRSGRGIYATTDLSYEIDSLNLLTCTIGFYPDVIDRTGSQLVTLSDDTNDQYSLDNTEDYRRNALDLGLNYQLGFKNNKDRLLTASYKYMGAATYQDIHSLSNKPVFDDFKEQRQQNKASSKEQTIQLDYVHPLKKLNIEGGFKAILRGNYSDFNSRSFSGNLQNESVDEFDYLQRVYAFYNSYQYKFNGRDVVKTGLRLERTTNDADFTTQHTAFNNSYNNLIPSIALQHRFKNEGSINLGYTQRIQRPNIWQLNPFVNKSNNLFYTSGNPDLLPVLNHNFDLSYSKFGKGSFVVGLSYMFADNTIQNIVTPLSSTVSLSSYENIGKSDNVGLDVNINYLLTKKLSVNLSGRLAHLWFEGTVNGNAYRNKGAQGHINSNWSYTLGNDWHLSADLNYSSSSISLQGQTNSFTYSALRLSKEVFNKQAAFMVAIINPFPEYRSIHTRLTTTGFIQDNTTRMYYRGVHVNFYYRFGKLKESIKKNKRGVSNDDVDKMK